MKKFVSFVVALALVVGFSACEKDQPEAGDGGVKLEYTSPCEDRLDFVEVALSSKEEYQKFGKAYNGSADVPVAKGVVLGKGNTSIYGNGNTRTLTFAEDAEACTVLIAYHWGNLYKMLKFEVDEWAGCVFHFNGQPLSGLRYGFEGEEKCLTDVDALEAAFDAAEDAFADDEKCYTEDSMGALLEAYNAGKELDLDECLYQDDVDAATQAILDALEGLEEVDWSALEDAIEDAAAFKEDAACYTKDSYGALVAAVEAGKELMEDCATQQDIDDAAQEIQDAIDGLVVKITGIESLDGACMVVYDEHDQGSGGDIYVSFKAVSECFGTVIEFDNIPVGTHYMNENPETFKINDYFSIKVQLGARPDSRCIDGAKNGDEITIITPQGNFVLSF